MNEHECLHVFASNRLPLDISPRSLFPCHLLVVITLSQNIKLCCLLAELGIYSPSATWVLAGQRTSESIGDKAPQSQSPRHGQPSCDRGPQTY